MNKINQILQKGLYSENTEVSEEGAIWETFPMKDVVVQAPYQGDEFRVSKSNFLYNRLSLHDVPVPEIIESSKKAPAFAVYENIGDKTLRKAEEEYERERYLNLVEQAGEALAKIHQVSGYSYGEPVHEQDFKAGTHNSWRNFTEEMLERTLDYVEQEPFAPIVDQLKSKVELEQIPEKPESSILHNDYYQDNILVDEEDSVGVIDLDNALYGDPNYDYVFSQNMVARDDQEVQKRFRKGYEKEKSVRLSPAEEESYRALAILQEAVAGEWTLRNKENPSYISEWAEGLEETAESHF